MRRFIPALGVMAVLGMLAAPGCDSDEHERRHDRAYYHDRDDRYGYDRDRDRYYRYEERERRHRDRDDDD